MNLWLLMWAERPKVFIEWTGGDVTFHGGVHQPVAILKIHSRTILGATNQWPHIYLFLLMASCIFPMNQHPDTFLHHYSPVNHASLSVLFLLIFVTPSLHSSASSLLLCSSPRLMETEGEYETDGAGACQRYIHSWDDHLCLNQTSLYTHTGI